MPNVFERCLTVWMALATVVGVLIEVPVMLWLVWICLQEQHWFSAIEP